jgi:NAD(P)-dependent dehydrogenase (short-subunit alcohol dehydrogenase family)
VSGAERQRVLLITGAASGIGAATARAFARNGYAVAMGDVTAEGLRAVEEELLTAGADAAGVVADVADPAAVARFVAFAVERFGDLDVVCPNAGVFVPEAPLEEMTDDQFEALIAVNLRGVFNVLRAALPNVVDGGAIVLTSSISGLQAHPGAAVYAATKIAMIGLGRSLAAEISSRRIRVNMVCPGGVDTPFTRRAYGVEADRVIAEYEQTNPLGRIAQPEDIAAGIVFLASPEARHVNGIALRVDGGDCLLGAV